MLEIRSNQELLLGLSDAVGGGWNVLQPTGTCSYLPSLPGHSVCSPWPASRATAISCRQHLQHESDTQIGIGSDGGIRRRLQRQKKTTQTASSIWYEITDVLV